MKKNGTPDYWRPKDETSYTLRTRDERETRSSVHKDGTSHTLLYCMDAPPPSCQTALWEDRQSGPYHIENAQFAQLQKGDMLIFNDDPLIHQGYDPPPHLGSRRLRVAHLRREPLGKVAPDEADAVLLAARWITTEDGYKFREWRDQMEAAKNRPAQKG